MKYLVVFLVLVGLTFSLNDNTFAVCCLPYDVIHHVDPETGFLVVSGELWNDSYKEKPFGKVDYNFRFTDDAGDVLFERDILFTEGLPIEGGFTIPHRTAFPFQIVIDDVDRDVIEQIAHVSASGNNNIDYFAPKPADLELTFVGMENVKTIYGKDANDFNKWKIYGTITNKHTEKTENVYVLASLYGLEHESLVGVAGYSDEDVQPLTLKGFETKEFTLYATIPSNKIPEDVRLYAESDDSSMIHRFYHPITLKQEFPEYFEKDDGTPFFAINTHVSNISRDNLDFDFIIQIKKDPEDDDAITINDPKSTVEYIDTVQTILQKQSSTIIEYEWTPTEPGIYFYEIYVWSDLNAPVALSSPFEASFLHHTMLSYD